VYSQRQGRVWSDCPPSSCIVSAYSSGVGGEAVLQNPTPAQAADLAKAAGSRNCIVCHGMQTTGLP